ncbi:MAG: cysteine hydrolase [Deltaproteobacteria bacterium]|nr:cysteine hydrolase [Deltaproteobacteria bacterium]
MRSDVCFFDIDTQVDFINQRGALPAPGADRIVPNLQRLIAFAAAEEILVVSTADAHTPDDPEFTRYPSHCVKGTLGQAKVKGTLLPRAVRIPPEVQVSLPMWNSAAQIIFEKRSVDAFQSANLPPFVAALPVPRVVLFGVCTDICVRYAAEGLLKAGKELWVVTDAVTALNEDAGTDALAEFRRSGAELLTCKEAIRRLETPHAA